MRRGDRARDARSARGPVGARCARRAACALAALVAAAPLAFAPAPATAAFEEGATRESLQRELGAPPDACASSGLALDVCSWRVARGEPGFAPLAAGRDDAPYVQLVCSFPRARAGAPPEVGTRCTVHAAPTAFERREAVRTGAARARRAQGAAAFAAARTLADLSHLLGAAPRACVERERTEWVCLWRVAEADAGHAVAASLAETLGDVELVCRLPIDGGPRDDDACRARPAR